MKNSQPLWVGLLAGIAAGLMMLAAFRAGFSAVILIFAAPAAVYIAAMGWGTLAGIVSAATAAVLVFMTTGFSAAVMASALSYFPAAWVGHLANLGRPADDGEGMIWYPLSEILFRLMIALALGFWIFGLVSGYSPELVIPAFVELMREMGSANPDLPALTDTQLQQSAKLYASMIPLVVPAMWLLFHVLIAALSAAIARRSNLLARAPDDIAASLNLPPAAFIFAIAGLVGTLLLSGAPQMAASVLLGLAIGGYGLVGLADLHYRTRNWPARGILLALVYTAIVLFSLPILFFTGIGFLRSLGAMRGPGAGAGPPTT